jgi:hypothetical protein
MPAQINSNNKESVMNEFQTIPYGMEQQYAPQGFFGGLLGAPLGGLIGKGIGGLFGNAQMGNKIGQWAGGVGGTLLPFGADPVQQAQLQQQIQQEQLMQQAQMGQQLNPQGFFGNLIGQVGRPLGSMIGSTFGNRNLGNTIGGIAGGLGRFLPFSADPVQQAQIQQQMQLEQQQQMQQLQQAQQAQQAQQLNPQGWFGDIVNQVGRPLGGAIGGAFGNAGLGNAIGDVASQIGRILPFNVDPQSLMANPPVAYYAYQRLLQQVQQLQQQLQQQQQQYAQLAQSVGQQQQQQQPQAGQQGQIAPQGWFGNLIGQVGQPLGGAIGGMFGNSQLGSNIGGVAGHLGRMLPFGADPVAQAYAQQAQLAQANSYYPQAGMQYAQPTLH